jgi:hypothetical protein
MDFRNLPPDVQAQLIEELMSDPARRAVNDYGQGSGFLSESKKPTSWARMGDKNDLVSDFLRTTQSYLKDYIPDLYPEAEDPGLFTGYRSDVADMYRNNPAYQQIDAAMAEGASFDEAVDLVASSDVYAQHLPKDEYGKVNRNSFRGSAEQYVSERAREGREFDAHDAQRQEYEDFVNPRDEWRDRGNDDIDLNSLVRRTDHRESLLGSGGQLQEGIERLLSRRQNSGGVLDRVPTVASQLSRIGATTDPSVQISNATANRSPARNAARLTPTATDRGPQPRRTAAQKNESNMAYNRGAQSVYDFQKNKQSQNTRQSKQQENLARTAALYNMIMYGE